MARIGDAMYRSPQQLQQKLLMKIWVGVTDNDWFEMLRALAPDEVNFWQQSCGREFRVLSEGEPFVFKLRRMARTSRPV